MFGSVRFNTKNLEDMEKIMQYICGNPEWTEKDADSVDWDVLTTDDDDLNWDLFDDADTLISACKKVLKSTGVTADYKGFYEGDRVKDNFIVYNGSKIQQYALMSDEDAIDTEYEAIIDCIEDGDIYLGWYDSTDSVDVGVFYEGKCIGGRTVIIETEEEGSECYSRMDNREYYLTLYGTDINLADSLTDFENLTDDEISEKCVAYFKENDSDREELLEELSDNSGVDFPEDYDISELEFRVLPHKEESVIEDSKVETANAPAPAAASEEQTTANSAPAPEKDVSSSKIKCPNCGTENEAGNAFCDTCGTKLAGLAPFAGTSRTTTAFSSLQDRLDKMQSDMDAKLDSFFGKK